MTDRNIGMDGPDWPFGDNHYTSPVKGPIPEATLDAFSDFVSVVIMDILESRRDVAGLYGSLEATDDSMAPIIRRPLQS